ncbi:MAG: hypothetical protein WCK42_04125 [Myxococcaceae bacterium]
MEALRKLFGPSQADFASKENPQKPIDVYEGKTLEDKKTALIAKKLILQGDPTFTKGEDLSEKKLTNLTNRLLTLQRNLWKSLWSHIYSKEHIHIQQEIDKIFNTRKELHIKPSDTIKQYNEKLRQLEISHHTAMQTKMQRELKKSGNSVDSLDSFEEQQRTLSQFRADPELYPRPEVNPGQLKIHLQELTRISEKIQADKLIPDTYLEHLSHQIAYQELEVGRLLPARTKGNFYKVTQVFKNKEGLVAYGLESQSKKEPPILLFQGTDPENTAQLHLDIAKEIGEPAITAAQEELRIWLEKYPGATLTGHSLGGAKAQKLATLYPKLIGAVITFCSPGLTQETASQFSKSVIANPKGWDPITVRHYVAEHDLVSIKGGETHIRGDLIVLKNSYGYLESHQKSILLETQEQGRTSELPQPINAERETPKTEKNRQSGPYQWVLKQGIALFSKTSKNKQG